MNYIKYIKLYESQLKEDNAEECLLEGLEQLDEAILITAIAIRYNKPKIRQYLMAIINWAFEEYDGSLNINDIRKSAYDIMREDNEMRDEFSPGFSKILSKKVLSGLKKGSKEFAKILGQAIGRIAYEAKMSKEELNRIFQETT